VKVALPYIIYLHMVLSNFWYDYLINALFFFKKKKKRKKKKNFKRKKGNKEKIFFLYFYTELVKMHK
jgi:hypothetical protein